MLHLVTAILFVLNFPGVAGDPVHPDVVATVQRSIVAVRGADSWCTGFVVGITRVVTAQHCVEGEGNVTVEGLPARVLRTGRNLALVDTQVLSKPRLLVAQTDPAPGDSVATLGHAYGGPVLIYQRQVAGYVIQGYMLLDGVISPGMSGGPGVNNKGEVVGVNEATNQEITAITTLRALRKFLDDD